MAGLLEPLSQIGSIKFGPFLSCVDFKTPLTDLIITPTDIRISKNNNAFEKKSGDSNATHDENGWYDIEINSEDLPLGPGQILVSVIVPGALPVWRKFETDYNPI